MSDAKERELERHIAEVLTAVGNAAPPQGMERRLQLALQKHASDAPRRSMFLDWRWAVPAAGMAVVAMTVFAYRHAHVSPAFLALGLRMEQSAPQVHRPVPRAADVHAALRPLQPRASAHDLPAALRHEPPASIATGAEHDHPPPPLPLTAEEKMLLQVVHRGEPLQMAALDDAHLRGIDFAAQKEQFDDFFYLHAQENSNDAQ